jgi:hypothetical protein
MAKENKHLKAMSKVVLNMQLGVQDIKLQEL